MSTTFLRDPGSPAIDRMAAAIQDSWEPVRAWGVRDRKRWVATLRTETRSLTVPGAGAATLELEVDALTNVTVAATHRRRGLMSQMMGAALRAAAERGDPLSMLIAAEWPIYGRFGYAPAVPSADYVLRRPRARFQPASDMSRVRQVERDEFAAHAHGVFARARRQRAGQVDRSELWWNRLLGREGHEPAEGLPHNWLVHEGDAGPDGLLAWTAGGDWGLVPPYGHVDVWGLFSAGEEAYRDLWSYLCGIDLVDEIRLPLRAVDEPVRWMLGDGRALVTAQLVDLVWIRLLDVAAALGSRRYGTSGELVLEVRDGDPGGFAAGRYRLSAQPGEAQCEPTSAPADLEITQRALACAYLGGYRLHELLPAGEICELRPGALARAAAMFATPLAPWNATWF